MGKTDRAIERLQKYKTLPIDNVMRDIKEGHIACGAYSGLMKEKKGVSKNDERSKTDT